MYEYHARNQLTLWGPAGNIIDYANKQWSGLVRDYYRPRWELFAKQLLETLDSGRVWNQTRFVEDVYTYVELPFNYASTIYATQPIGCPRTLAQSTYRKWTKYMTR